MISLNQQDSPLCEQIFRTVAIQRKNETEEADNHDTLGQRNPRLICPLYNYQKSRMDCIVDVHKRMEWFLGTSGSRT
jgi:hypothetical protein